MKTILITAYAINPYKGSEDGTGWNISREIAKNNKVIVITRKNNIPHIEKFLAESNDPILENMSFLGYDLPNRIMKLKKKLGERGYVLYFYFWQMFIVRFIKKNNLKFDIAHSLNFHSDSQPQFLWMLGKPTFWGPIGHHPKVPKKYLLPIYGRKNFIKDRLYFNVKWVLRNLDPFFRLAVWKSKRIFTINSSISKVISAKESKVSILSAVASEAVSKNNNKESKLFKILSVGRFHYMKGFDISIKAFAHFHRTLTEEQQQNTFLTLVGKGSEKTRLQTIAAEENITSQIEWIGWVEKDQMKNIYENSSIFLFPSHEGAGMVVPEALSYGLPIVCFENVGPGELSGNASLKVQYGNYEKSILDFSQHLQHLFENEFQRNVLSNISKEKFQNTFTWAVKGSTIEQAYCA
ncbi:MAG: glycosyltransferase involved in cell wall biosynthesis [Parvicella sp.]|jgi:glycosyltransferase involved in cell wall biosynthesis